MSGVGVSGLIANLPGTVTPYPTQDPALELGGYRSVANAAARDAIPANFRSIGMQVTLQDTGVTYQLVGGILNANYQVLGGAAQPFRGQFFVDPTFTGVRLGSAANPFVTIAAAIAAAVALASANTIIYTNSITENVTLPATGNWELSAPNKIDADSATTLTGNVDASATATSRVAITDLCITGNITGLVANGVNRRLRLTGCAVFGTTTLTATGTGFWRLELMGRAASGDGNGLGGYLNATLSIAGQLVAELYALADVTFTKDQNHYISSCDFFVPATLTFANTGITNLQIDSTRSTGLTLNNTGGGTPNIALDGRTAAYVLGSTGGITRTGVVNIGPAVAEASRRVLAATNNVSAQQLAKKQNCDLMVAEASLTLLVPGTAGAAVLNVVYTNATGTIVTRPVTSALNIAGAAGDSVQGTLPFIQTGATDIQYTITGIVTPGALSYRYAVACRMAG